MKLFNENHQQNVFSCSKIIFWCANDKKNDNLSQKMIHFRSKMIILPTYELHLVISVWVKIVIEIKNLENRKFEGLEISVKIDRAVKSEKFFNPGWSWPTLSEFLWFPSCYQPQTKLKMSQFIRFFRLRPRGLYRIFMKNL